ncbi:Uu.00g109670.m01.CDS01 [Anthostomella pinea]|uniref:Uu.00g109670.m01.CDS01 n=1 Tax=Anthostomella pinea TaxID=933095 RepID=A0AAI8VEQ0_9PEZI|nr:Uu.00g109670.m01.CDS01 [Anthostomella pinea]
MSSGFVGNVQAKASEVAKEDFDKFKALASDAAKSGAYMYPFKGIAYFCTHRALWKPFASRILPTLGLTAGVLGGMFFLTYLPQLAVLVFVNGPLAVFTTVLLILNESSMIVNIISRNFMLQDALLDTFDGTLVSKNATGIVSEGRQLKSGSDPIARLGKIMKSPFSKFTPKALVRYVMYLPLNFIPIVGTAIFILIQGRGRGSSVHGRYFQLKGWSQSQQQDWLERHTAPYTTFGTIATLLEMVPFASMFFAFTNTVGAALWAADIEQKNTQMTAGTAPNLRESAKKSE